MRHWQQAIGLAALAIASLGASGVALAQSVKGSATISTYDNSPNSIWITIYDVGKTRHLDYGCVATKDTRDWKSGTYLYGSFYYVRAEVKANKDCSGKTLCDTTMRINPQSSGPATPPGIPGNPSIANTKVSLEPNGSNCYLKYN
jgi:hypothetical protein